MNHFELFVCLVPKTHAQKGKEERKQCHFVELHSGFEFEVLVVQ